MTFNLAAFEEDLAETLKQSDVAFKSQYKDVMNELSGLSESEVDSITPGVSDLQKYDELIALIKMATKHNLDQAMLKEQIVKLGDTAMKIAEKVPSLAKLIT